VTDGGGPATRIVAAALTAGITRIVTADYTGRIPGTKMALVGMAKWSPCKAKMAP
jgi:hypothetical protein